MGGQPSTHLRYTDENGDIRVRIPDSYRTSEGRRYSGESKVGYQSYSRRLRREIRADCHLLKEDLLDEIEWHFFASAPASSRLKTKSVGLSAPLLQALTSDPDCPVKIILHLPS